MEMKNKDEYGNVSASVIPILTCFLEIYLCNLHAT